MNTYRIVLLCIGLLTAGAAQASTVTYSIDVDTAAIEGTSGYLDFQLNPGNTPFDAASAVLADFTTDGTLTGALPDLGAVSGDLPGTVTIDNTDLPNEYTDGITYGSFFDIFVTLDIPVVSGMASGGSSFTLDAEDTEFNSVLATTFPLVEIDLDAITGAPTVINNSSNGQPLVTAAPEPGSMWLFVAGLAGAAAWLSVNKQFKKGWPSPVETDAAQE